MSLFHFCTYLCFSSCFICLSVLVSFPSLCCLTFLSLFALSPFLSYSCFPGAWHVPPLCAETPFFYIFKYPEDCIKLKVNSVSVYLVLQLPLSLFVQLACSPVESTYFPHLLINRLLVICGLGGRVHCLDSTCYRALPPQSNHQLPAASNLNPCTFYTDDFLSLFSSWVCV